MYLIVLNWKLQKKSKIYIWQGSSLALMDLDYTEEDYGQKYIFFYLFCSF